MGVTTGVVEGGVSLGVTGCLWVRGCVSVGVTGCLWVWVRGMCVCGCDGVPVGVTKGVSGGGCICARCICVGVSVRMCVSGKGVRW